MKPIPALVGGSQGNGLPGAKEASLPIVKDVLDIKKGFEERV